jgi:hypothetical protein
MTENRDQWLQDRAYEEFMGRWSRRLARSLYPGCKFLAAFTGWMSDVVPDLWSMQSARTPIPRLSWVATLPFRLFNSLGNTAAMSGLHLSAQESETFRGALEATARSARCLP